MLSPSTTRTGPGTVLDGRFEILSTLGNGAMSVVVSARHLQLRQHVAIKLLRPEFAGYSDVVTRFLREGRAAACLRNEHVVSVTDVGMLPTGVPYLIMEYLEGTDLAAHLATQGPVPVDQAVEYVFQTLEALAEAHRAGIIHRDIKPANLLLARREDGSALIKVLDFGVSKLTGPEYTAHALTMQAPLLGSPAYMSPEQIKNPSDVDVRTDIWSIGIVLYELVTGQLPFAGRTAPELVSAIVSPQPTPISGLISRAPIELVGVIGRCLHKDREGRFGSVQELARGLMPFVRTAASQVSVDRILGIASAPRPVAPDLSVRSSEPPAHTSNVRDSIDFGKSRRRSHAKVVGACLVGAGAGALASVLALALGRSPAAPQVPLSTLTATGASLCPAPEAASGTAECVPPAAAGPTRVSSDAPLTAPATPGLAELGGNLTRRPARSARVREEVLQSPLSVRAPEPTTDVAPEPITPKGVLAYPGARNLDPQNPYSPR